MMVVILLIVITAFLSPASNYFLIRPFRELIGEPMRAEFNILHSFMGGLRGALTVAGFAVAIKLIKYWYLKKIENEQLEKEKLRGELEILKAQVHPHFMFNTLNSIYALSLKKSDETSAAILKLSQLMRYILTECKQSSVDLAKEVEILQHYIELEKSRFYNRMDMTINIRGDLTRDRIAPLVLLPFVENSFKHGVNEMIEQAWISLDLEVSDHQLRFKLINGRAEGPVHPDSVQVGLQNVKKRIGLLYPKAHELRITEDADTFVVSLVLQLNAIKAIEA